MPKYMTKQRKNLLAFLEQHADEELSAKIIESELGGMGVSISAVYRNLSDLEKEGKVRRVSKSGTREVYYLYTDAHMLINTLAQSDDFTIDKSETVLYGVCKDCKNN